MGDAISGVLGVGVEALEGLVEGGEAGSVLGEAGSVLGEVGEAAGVLGEVGGALGEVGSVAGMVGDVDPESLAIDLVGKLAGPVLGINDTDLGIAKAVVGAISMDPLAIAGGALEAIGGLAKGESPFEPIEKVGGLVEQVVDSLDGKK